MPTEVQTLIRPDSEVVSDADGKVPVFATVMVAVQMSPGAKFETVSVVDPPVPEKPQDPPLLVVPGVTGVANTMTRVPALALPFTYIEDVKVAKPTPVSARSESAKRETIVVFVIIFGNLAQSG